MPWRSLGSTLRTRFLGNFGSTVSAKSIFRVLAGGSRQCALFSASTAPVSASATIHDFAVSFAGSAGTPGVRCTCVPGTPSRSPPTVDRWAGGLRGPFVSAGAALATPVSTVPPSSAVAAETAQTARA
jgi:hypothetical protein